MKLKLIMCVLAIFWIGMIIAIGMESIVKFSTPLLSKPVGFDVGRVVFDAFNKVQAGLLLILLMLAFLTRASITAWDKFLLAGLSAVFAAQVFWLFPALSERVALILAGIAPPPSYKHLLYGILELLKLIILTAIGLQILLIVPSRA